MSNVFDTAVKALDLGLRPVLIRPGTKRAEKNQWPDIIYTQDTIQEFQWPGCGIGLVWGHGHTDVDLETPETACMAALLLPKTEFRWGRRGNSEAHMVYQNPDSSFKKVKVKAPDGTSLVEIRSLGCQSIIPPSTYLNTHLIPPAIDGEYQWVGGVEFGQAPTVDQYELEQQVKETVFAAVMAEKWGTMTGSRHDAMIGICGMLMKTGRGLNRTTEVCEAIIVLGKDPDPEDRRQIPATTAAKLAAGEDISGYTMVEAALGLDIAKWAAKLFHLPTEKVTQAGGMVFNDTGNADLMCKLFGSDLMYLKHKRAYAGWTGERWDVSNSGMLEQSAAKKTVNHMAALAPTMPTATERAALRQHALRSGDAGPISAMISLARDTLAVNAGALDRGEWLFNLPNGTLNLGSGLLQPHNREDYISKLGGVEYDPIAECPRWQAFIDDITVGNRELGDFLQRMAGYCLTANTREQCMFFLYGQGKNGKTTFIEVLTSIFGDYAVRTPADTLLKKRGEAGIPNDVARLLGARFVASKEIAAGVALAENVVKDLTGGDTTTARFLREEFFDFKPVLKLVMYGNHKPTISGNDKGIWRRIRLVPFAADISDDKQVDDLAAKLVEAEGPGILRWALEGCMKWQVSGLMTPPIVLEATSEYREEMDVFGEFLREHYVLGKGKMDMANVYMDYQTWCSGNGERQITQRQLNLKMLDAGCRKLKSNGKWWLVGLSKAVPTPSDTPEAQNVEVS